MRGVYASGSLLCLRSSLLAEIALPISSSNAFCCFSILLVSVGLVKLVCGKKTGAGRDLGRKRATAVHSRICPLSNIQQMSQFLCPTGTLFSFVGLIWLACGKNAQALATWPDLGHRKTRLSQNDYTVYTQVFLWTNDHTFNLHMNPSEFPILLLLLKQLAYPARAKLKGQRLLTQISLL